MRTVGEAAIDIGAPDEVERGSWRNSCPLPGGFTKTLARPPNIAGVEAIRASLSWDPMHDRRIGLLSRACDLGQDAHENLGLTESISRPLLNLTSACRGVGTLAASHDHIWPKQASCGNHPPKPGFQLQFLLDNEVREVVRQGRIKGAVIGVALQAHHHPIVATSQGDVIASLTTMKRDLHSSPTLTPCTATAPQNRPATEADHPVA